MGSASDKLRIIVGGLVGQYPLGGVAWDYFHYVLGLHELGHEVYYDENTNTWPYDPVQQQPSADGTVNAHFIDDFFRAYAPELASRWHYCVLLKDHHGMSKDAFEEVARTADVYLNVSGGNLLIESLSPKCVKVFMDTDPGFTQIGLHDVIENKQPWRFSGSQAHDRYLTYAENIHADDCVLPKVGLDWITTRPIATLTDWEQARATAPKDNAMTTVMTLSFTKELKRYHYNGVDYFDKRPEFERFIDLPARSPLPLRLAVGRHDWAALIVARGWQLIHAPDVSATPQQYQQFIADSFGEWSIAKNYYAATRSGWFSCRTCCYLAAGRPAVVQDTTWSRYIPSGRGLMAFSTMDESVAGLEAVAANPQQHRDAAYEIAREYFAPDKVLPPMLEAILASPAARAKSPASGEPTQRKQPT